MSDNFNTFICANCNAQFSRKDNLKRHLSTRCYGLNLTELKSREPVKFFCAHCDRVFKQKRNLKTHLLSKRCPRLKNVQPEIQIPVSDNVCINCKATFTRKSSLKVHFSSRYPKRSNVFKPKEKGVVVLNFNSDEEFLLWKDEEEQRTLSKFSQSKGSWKTKRGEKTKYVCHRAGYVRIKDPSNRKRSLKRKGSCKINNHCTAFILIEKHSDGSVSAQYSRKHINHFIEIKHLPLSEHDKTEFASKLEEGVPFDRILDDVRDSLSDSRKLTRKHLISKHDLHNIKNEFKISFKEWLSSNDIVSVDLLIDQFKKTYGTETPFLYYKQQGVKDEVFEKDDILLVIMNPTQKTFLQKYGPDKICIDSTHCTVTITY